MKNSDIIDLKSLMDEVEECSKEETEYINILKISAEDPTQVSENNIHKD